MSSTQISEISFIENVEKKRHGKIFRKRSDLFQDSIIVVPKSIKWKDILSIGALNLKATQVQASNYKDCKFTEGLFKVSADEFGAVHSDGSLIPGKWTHLLS